jgi:hypothetical protein
MTERKRYSRFTPKQRELKHRAIEVAAFVIGLRIQEQQVKRGEVSYKKVLPADANWYEKYGNEGALRKGSIIRQAAREFGESEKQIYRHIKRVEHEGWFDEVQSKLDGVEARDVRGRIVFLPRSIRGRSTIVAVRRTRKQRTVRTS